MQYTTLGLTHNDVYSRNILFCKGLSQSVFKTLIPTKVTLDKVHVSLAHSTFYLIDNGSASVIGLRTPFSGCIETQSQSVLQQIVSPPPEGEEGSMVVHTPHHNILSFFKLLVLLTARSDVLEMKDLYATATHAKVCFDKWKYEWPVDFLLDCFGVRFFLT